jgi:hypothetical protein
MFENENDILTSYLRGRTELASPCTSSITSDARPTRDSMYCNSSITART